MKIKAFNDGYLFLGDCKKFMRSLPEQSVDLVFGSPPYEAQREYEELNWDLAGQDWVDWMVGIYMESLRVCQGLVAYVVGTGATTDYKWSAAPALLMADLHRKGVTLRATKFYRRYGIPGSGREDDLRKDVEYIVCATANRGRLVWSNNVACGRPMKFGNKTSITARNKKGVRDKRPRRIIKTEIANPGDLIDCRSVGGNHMGSKIAHQNEAPFAEKLVDFFIRTFCPPGGTVLDPFGGSGTTAASAIKNGRIFLTGDVRPSQVVLIRKRIKQARRKKGFGIIL